MTNHLNSSELEALLAQGKPVIVDFFATWCQPCKSMFPVVEALAQDLAGQAEVAKVDIEEAHEAAAKFGVRSVPTFIAFKEGRPVATRCGTAPRQRFVDWAKQAVA